MTEEKKPVEDKLQNPVLRVRLEVFIPYRDGSGKGNVMDSEVFMDINKRTTHNDVMKKVRDGVIDILITARKHKAVPPAPKTIPVNIDPAAITLAADKSA